MSKKDGGTGCAGCIGILVAIWAIKWVAVNWLWPLCQVIGSAAGYLYDGFLENVHYATYLLYPIGAGMGAAILWGCGHGIYNYVRSFSQHTGPERPWTKMP